MHDFKAPEEASRPPEKIENPPAFHTVMFLSFFSEVNFFLLVPDPQHRLKLRYNSPKSRYSISIGEGTQQQKKDQQSQSGK
jgi:hypothetical protein